MAKSQRDKDKRPLDKDGLPEDGYPDPNGFVFNRKANARIHRTVRREDTKVNANKSLAERQREADAARVIAEALADERKDARGEAVDATDRALQAGGIIKPDPNTVEFKEEFDTDDPIDVSGDDSEEDEGDEDPIDVSGYDDEYPPALKVAGDPGHIVDQLDAARARMQAESAMTGLTDSQTPATIQSFTGTRTAYVLGDKIAVSHPLTGAKVELALVCINWSDVDGEFSLTYVRSDTEQ